MWSYVLPQREDRSAPGTGTDGSPGQGMRPVTCAGESCGGAVIPVEWTATSERPGGRGRERSRLLRVLPRKALRSLQKP